MNYMALCFLRWLLPFKIRLHDQTITNKKILLDNQSIVGCKLIGCQIHYCGYSLDLRDNTFEQCSFHFHGPAAKTLGFLKAVYNWDGNAGKEMIHRIFGIKIIQLGIPSFKEQ